MALTQADLAALRTRMSALVDARVPAGAAEAAGDEMDGRRTSAPEFSDDAVRSATGRDWAQWRDTIEAWPGRDDGHAAVAAWLQAEHGVDGWWAQSVTVGWERITGRRLRYQVADGTFTVNKSATFDLDADELRELFGSDTGRDALFPGLEPQLRSRPQSKNPRIGLVDGVAEFAMSVKSPGRTTLTVSHAKLTSPVQTERWRDFWAAWLDTLASDTL